MGTGYEAAIICKLSPDLSDEVFNTLRYLTRDEDYEFEPSIDHEFFEFDEDIQDSWRYSISNRHPPDLQRQESYITQACRSFLSRDTICFRDTMSDDEFSNSFIYLSEWLATISAEEGVVGYYFDHVYQNDFHLLFVQNFGIIDQAVNEQDIPNELVEKIDQALGGISYITARRNQLY
jgi:hypothetical protein